MENTSSIEKIKSFFSTYTTFILIGLILTTFIILILPVKNDNSSTLTLSLNGNEKIYLKKGEQYIEPGYYAYDNQDGNLTHNVIIEGEVNTDIVGTYIIKYRISNSQGKNAYKVRVINVTESEDLQILIDYNPKEITNDKVTISLKANQDIYFIVDPEGNVFKKNEILYSVDDNDEYSFSIKTKDNKIIEKNIKITNIDKEKPTGTCTLTLTDTNGEIVIDAHDNNEIKGYEYTYGKNKTNIITSNKYTIDTTDDTASVTIYDKANNSNTINCTTVDNLIKQNREYTLESYVFNGITKKYWFYKPSISTRKKVPLVIYFHGAGGSENVNAVNNIVIPKNIKDGHDFPYYVVAPYNGGQNDFIMSLIDYLTSKYNIDSKRIVISGGSAGTPAALEIAAKNQNKFSAAVIIASYTNTPNTDVNKLTYLPIWFFQGTANMYSTVEKYVNKINAAGGNAMLTPYKGGHDAPADAFLREDLTQWILSNRAK